MQSEVPSVGATTSFDKAFQMMQESQASALPVVDAAGKLVGLITQENVGEMMMVNAARPRGGLRSLSFGS